MIDHKNKVTTKEDEDALRRMRCAERIKQRLTALGLSQADLARESGLSRGSISHYLHQRNTPNNLTAASLARVLKADPTWLSGYDVPSQPKAVPRELDSETTEKALELYQDENTRVLLDVKRILSEEDLQAVITLVKSLANRK